MRGETCLISNRRFSEILLSNTTAFVLICGTRRPRISVLKLSVSLFELRVKLFKSRKRQLAKTKQKKRKSSPFMCLRVASSQTHNNRQNMKSDLRDLDLLTPVFHCGNRSCNCFWGVPDPFTPRAAPPSWKHDSYLTHVLFSSAFMSEQSLWWCLCGVDVCFWLWTLWEGGGGGGRWFKRQHYWYISFQSGAFILNLYTPHSSHTKTLSIKWTSQNISPQNE